MCVKKSIENKKISVRNTVEPSSNVKTQELKKGDGRPLFSFVKFKMNSINIDGKFNNFYKNEQEYIKQISTILGMALPSFSNENIDDLKKDKAKKKIIHFHKIQESKREILEKILREYEFNDKIIDDIIYGSDVYQFEFMYVNGSCRAVVEIIDGIIYPLFMDTNHHIYFDKDLVKEANSLYYDVCPINEDGSCYRMNYIGTCFAFDFLDKDKIMKTYENSYDPLNNKK